MFYRLRVHGGLLLQTGGRAALAPGRGIGPAPLAFAGGQAPCVADAAIDAIALNDVYSVFLNLLE
ncbi:MAG: hypothetical protein CML67_12725 [Rhodobacteraceae bacterium]|nr:hypothetical protein [Paracoccaceae bacterium]